MKTKKVINKSTSLKKTIKKKQNGSGLFKRLFNFPRKNTTSKLTMKPELIMNKSINIIPQAKQNAIIIRNTLIELLKDKFAIEIAKKKLEKEKNKIIEHHKQTKTNPEDDQLFINITKDIDRLNKILQIEKIDKKINDITTQIDNSHTQIYLKNDQDITNLNKQIEDKLKNIKEVKEAQDIEKINRLFNNNAKSRYKKYSQFRVGLFNNIERNKKERKEREEMNTQRNKKELENIYQQLIENLRKTKEVYQYKNKINEILTTLSNQKRQTTNKAILSKIEIDIEKAQKEKDSYISNYPKKIQDLEKEYDDLLKKIPVVYTDLSKKLPADNNTFEKYETQIEQLKGELKYLENDIRTESAITPTNIRTQSQFFRSPMNNIEKVLAEVEQIYEKMVNNIDEKLNISKKFHKNEDFIKNISPMMEKIKATKNTSNHETNELLGKLEYYIKKKNQENDKHLDKINSLNQEFTVLTESLNKYNSNIDSVKIKKLKTQLENKQTEIRQHISPQ